MVVDITRARCGVPAKESRPPITALPTPPERKVGPFHLIVGGPVLEVTDEAAAEAMGVVLRNGRIALERSQCHGDRVPAAGERCGDTVRRERVGGRRRIPDGDTHPWPATGLTIALPTGTTTGDTFRRQPAGVTLARV